MLKYCLQMRDQFILYSKVLHSMLEIGVFQQRMSTTFHQCLYIMSIHHYVNIVIVIEIQHQVLLYDSHKWSLLALKEYLLIDVSTNPGKSKWDK